MVPALDLASIDRTAISFAAIPVAAVLVGDDGRILAANSAAGYLFGKRPLEFGGRVEEMLVPMDCVRAIADKSDPVRTCKVQLPSGRQADVALSVGVQHQGGNPPLYLVLLRDASQDLATRQERDRLLNIAGVGTALPALLHEIRTPLASITAAVELLIEEMEDSPTREQLHAVLSEVRRMNLSLDGVLAVGRSLRGRRYAAIDQTCRHAWQIMSARAKARGIHSRSAIDDMPLLLLDPAVVGGIVHNLMINSIQACSAGQAVNIQAQLQQNGKLFSLTVVDNGPGMTNEVYNRCTELFFTTKRNGSGIGLALCRRAVEEAGGTMTIESVIGFGTSVTIEIPLGEGDSSPHVDEMPMR